MSRGGDRAARVQALADLADELESLVDVYRILTFQLASNLDDLDLDRTIARELDLDRSTVLSLPRDRDNGIARDLDFARRLARGARDRLASRPTRDLAGARNSAVALSVTSDRLRRIGQVHWGGGVCEAWEIRTEVRVLGCLARLLPAHERVRFVAEEKGDLGDCKRWWQRIDHLAGVAIGTPRLAWMMRRERRQRRT
jgi:hypothetical protein